MSVNHQKGGTVTSHIMEVPYVFGHWDYKRDAWASVFSFAMPAGAKSPDPGLADVDKKVSETMMKLWTTFAKTGNPSIKGVFDWPAYQEATDQYLYITESLEVKSGFFKVWQK